MKTRLLSTAAAAALLAAGFASAESLPLSSVNKANEVIDAAIEAHGGAEALDGLKSLVQENRFVGFAVGQSRKPGEPWDQNESHNFSAVDLENEVFVTRNKGEAGGFTFDTGTIINGEESYQLDFRGKTAAPIAEPDYDTNSGPTIRVTPPLIIKQLMARRQTSHWLGEVDIDGRKHDVITLVMEVGPALSLYIDQESHMLTRMERVLPPFGQVEYEFSDYRTIDGVAFNESFKLYVNGSQNIIFEDLVQKVNAPIEQYTAVPAELQRIPAITPDDMNLNEIEEGVFLVGGNGAYGLFVEMQDHVVAIGGTQGVADRIKEMRKEISDKPVRYGVLTHHHSDHIPGTADYVAAGATVITFKENEEVVRAAAGDQEVTLEFVNDRMTLGSGDRRVELYNIGPTPHAENMLIAYLPSEGIVFEADHFQQPRTGPIPPGVSNTVALAAALDRLGLDYRTIVGAHSPRVGSSEDLKTAASRAASLAAAGGQ